MSPDEATAVSRLAGIVLGGGAARISELHAVIAQRVFAAIGPGSLPVKVAHDRMSSSTYRTVGGALVVGAAAVGVLAARRVDGSSVRDGHAARRWLAFLNGVYGDLLDREASALSIPMSVRQAGQTVSVRASAVQAAFPAASGRLAVFLHGLTETEDAWCYKSKRHHGRPDVTYGTLLEQDLGLTPVFIRYNSGLHISDNGRQLADLLDRLVEVWPVPVQDLVLIGHSMGGLVARSALHQASDGTSEAQPWTRLVRDTVTLGAPHLGAPLERGVQALTRTLARTPETKPLAKVLAARSAGIKDLGRGTLVEADWAEQDRDASTQGRHTLVPLHAGARHFVVLGTLTADPMAPAAHLFGDLLVPPLSASGDTGGDDRLAFLPDQIHRLGRLHHLDLLNHPRVYRQIRRWLETRPEGASPLAP